MGTKIAELIEGLRRVALFDSNMTVYVATTERGTKHFVLKSGDKTLAGAYLGQTDDKSWWRVDLLWASNAVSAIALLMTCLERLGKLVPSTDISPAASMVVERFYQKYLNTKVVVLDVQDDATKDHIAAGYQWVPGVIKPLNIPVVEVESRDGIRELLMNENLSTFQEAYADKKRTKKDITLQLNALLRKRDYEELLSFVSRTLRWRSSSNLARIEEWAKDNAKYLKGIDASIANEIKYYKIRYPED
jgi:hypothetical protein